MVNFFEIPSIFVSRRAVLINRYAVFVMPAVDCLFFFIFILFLFYFIASDGTDQPIHGIYNVGGKLLIYSHKYGYEQS